MIGGESCQQAKKTATLNTEHVYVTYKK